MPYTISGAPLGGTTRAATARIGSEVGDSCSIGNRDQIEVQRSPASPGRSVPVVDTLRKPEPGVTKS